ncbi:hypothetical protein [Sphingomonas sp. HMP6]|uniref:hypothetical protein n=1 Tax=Sphingomonas sp. HMP6 TaxID=1517551 RepID=UPI0015967DFF|nr:hypothetical protein [Sphingomonas sp. HMP6]
MFFTGQNGLRPERDNRQATNRLFDRYRFMSMYSASYVPTASSCDYVLAAPRASDVLSATLRAAYATELTAYEQFSDLIQQLDLIEILPARS